MKIKVCGITRKEDLDALVQLGADYAGFIFYGKSPRFAGNKLDGRTVREIAGRIGKVGVFVNADPQQVIQTVKDYGLDMIQLHGDESIAVCQQLRLTVPVMKVFPMGEKANAVDYAAPFMAVSDFFLFDTASKEYGGTGRQFNWELLNDYSYDKPFFLSGGIGPDDTEAVLRWRHKQLFALDVNSRFETAPGVKDMDKVAAFINTIKK
ncbi:phosphoribosylanthranilate isomerase [Chitinophaga barathri]|uniref:N-(5'-phosphoribosyl)anthranilate isomerase n=1 Tax=Chitinophaga barathri TaxID=1647451 RepID=A0A3N4MLH3_9BACT|nr:phosphoribosylanthranilate isomerase [Chitinophaga barathri]RPD40910.1 phosphoribosylanthranilate isomerase [Chitinophaga barathri]